MRNAIQMPMHHFLGYVLGEISAVGPITSLELFERLNGKETGPDDSLGLHAITLPLIQWANMQLESRRCVFLGEKGWHFKCWPSEGSFGEIETPDELLRRAAQTPDEKVVLIGLPSRLEAPPATPAKRVPSVPEATKKPPAGKAKQAALFS